jgi:hypothetical protein
MKEKSHMATQKQTFTTSKGVAVYPHLNKPDFAFNSDGVYSTKIRIKPSDAADLVEAVKKAANDEFGKAANTARMPYSTDNETGELVFLAKSKFRPKKIDSTGHLIPESAEPEIYGGSVIKLAGTVYPYTAGGNKGVSLQLAAVQIISLADPVGSSFAFEAEEDGYVAQNDNHEPAQNDNGEGETPQEAYNF